jgi:alkane 1-monooxygenase
MGGKCIIAPVLKRTFEIKWSAPMTPWKYTLVFVIPALTIAGLLLGGPWLWAAPFFVFVIVPLAELVLPSPTDDPDAAASQSQRSRGRFDAIVYGAIPVQLGTVLLFLWQFSAGSFGGVEALGAIVSVGLGCGGVGINIGHELGHRLGKRDQLLAQLLLGSSLYAHFFIEHNRGHHSRVATPDDPASARYGELVYTFWFRSVTGGWRSAWQLEFKRLGRRGLPRWSWHNQMLRFQVAQGAALLLITLVFGPLTTLAFIAASLVGILLLETVNYLEHYGLRRQRTSRGRWERVQSFHSWNSNRLLGRLLLFELTRHSDHHAHPKRHYSELRHFDEAPQLPAGYPAMVLIALVPPLFFALMHPRLPGSPAAASQPEATA